MVLLRFLVYFIHSAKDLSSGENYTDDDYLSNVRSARSKENFPRLKPIKFNNVERDPNLLQDLLTAKTVFVNKTDHDHSQKVDKLILPALPHSFRWSQSKLDVTSTVNENNSKSLTARQRNVNAVKSKPFVPLIRLSGLLSEEFSLDDIVNPPSSKHIPEISPALSRASRSDYRAKTPHTPDSVKGIPQMLLERQTLNKQISLIDELPLNSEKMEQEIAQRRKFAQKVLIESSAEKFVGRDSIQNISVLAGRAAKIHSSRTYAPRNSLL